MRKIIYLGITLLIFLSCKREGRKDYVTLSGTISNQNSGSLSISYGKFRKIINVSANGTFSDTLKVDKEGDFNLFDGKEFTKIYLKNGFKLNLTVNAKEFDETIRYNGYGKEANNFLVKKHLLKETLNNSDLLMLENGIFNIKLESSIEQMINLLRTTKKLDSSFVAKQKKNIEGLEESLKEKYKQKQYFDKLLGKDSPKFVDYVNFAGGTTSLDDLKGKYVYIDFWATWCIPCLIEIPFLKELEEKYHNRNIEFVSISLDKKAYYKAWKSMVNKKEMTGIQLFVNGDKSFKEAYSVKSIPRFILIDPEGKIISANAPRPSSSEEITKLFDELNIN